MRRKFETPVDATLTDTLHPTGPCVNWFIRQREALYTAYLSGTAIIV